MIPQGSTWRLGNAKEEVRRLNRKLEQYYGGCDSGGGSGEGK